MIVSLSAVILVNGTQVLLGRRPAKSRFGGLWEIPGGKLNPSETPAEAALREIREELGIGVGDLRIFSVNSWETGADSYVLTTYTGIPDTLPTTSTAHDELRWFGFDEIAPAAFASFPVTKPNIPVLASFHARFRGAGGGR